MPLKRYRDYNTYLKELFGERVQKISLDAGLSCPNRDGTISSKGCIYCDPLGSGTGAMIKHGIGLEEQITAGIKSAEKRYKAKKFIAYFQSFTNTYAPAPKLREMYQTALKHKGIVGLSVGTRPDCIDDEILDLFSSLQKDYLVWIEYGLQSAHDATLSRINRGHDVACFERAVHMTKEYRINICPHVILGLPGEDHDMMMDTARFVASLPVDGIKIHSLYVTKGTALAEMYENGEYTCLERKEYIETLIDFIELLPPEMVIQRLTGDPNPTELLAPQWTREKTLNLNLINNRMAERDTWQGKKFVRSAAA
ncbi:MAG: TIGR01212 family radical SAM protein [Deltaproteobacteria bacterium]|nr:TIGR01212 family radical SAM protein [Deltaproteobacteria bacterium]